MSNVRYQLLTWGHIAVKEEVRGQGTTVYKVGQKVANYRLIRKLGRGGFADVYLGEHLYLQTAAAIKVLHKHLDEPSLQQFLIEARTLVSLEHPHIVRVLDCGVEEGVPFLVMSYAPYGSLRQCYPPGSVLAPSMLLTYVKQVASALQYAHDRGIIHRDVKPENLLLGAERTVLLSDFGLSVISSSAFYSGHLDTYTRAGTTIYMAPEQFKGQPSRVSDQYALGVIVYEWLSGRHPFQGTEREVAMQHLYAEPPPLLNRVSQAAAAFEPIVLKALAKDPKERFPRVQDFASALEEAWLAVSPHSSILTPNSSQQLPFETGTTSAYEIIAPDHVSATSSTAGLSTKTTNSHLDPLSEQTTDTPLMFWQEPASAARTVLLQQFGRRFPRRTIIQGGAGLAAGILAIVAAEQLGILPLLQSPSVLLQPAQEYAATSPSASHTSDGGRVRSSSSEANYSDNTTTSTTQQHVPTTSQSTSANSAKQPPPTKDPAVVATPDPDAQPSPT